MHLIVLITCHRHVAASIEEVTHGEVKQQEENTIPLDTYHMIIHKSKLSRDTTKKRNV